MSGFTELLGIEATRHDDGRATVVLEVPVTVEMNVNHLEPGRPGTLTATALVRRRGTRFTLVEAEVTQDGGEVVALGTGTFTTVS